MNQLPLIREMHDAPDDRARAEILLRLPDAVVLRHAPIFAEACRRARFEDGFVFVELRVAALMATRDAAGLLPARTVQELDALRAALARYCAGAGGDDPPAHLDI
jgi:hypothetical protein